MNKPIEKVLSEEWAKIPKKNTFKMSPWLIVLQISKAQCAFQFIQK